MSTSLTRSAGDLGTDTWTMMKEQAGMLVKTGFLPSAIKTAEQAVAIMLKGRELNIPSMYALSNIAVIQGKPVANAELMLALIFRDHGDEAIRFTRTDGEVCTITYRRRTWKQPQTYSYSIAEAKMAGLLGNQTWQKYPQAMLRARCVSAVARLCFPDSIGGMYTPEELGASVTVSEEGLVEVIDVSPPPQLTATQELFDAPREPDPRQPLRDELRTLRQELAAAGGRPSNLRSSQVMAMTAQDLKEEIALTRDELKRLPDEQQELVAA